MVCGRPLFQQVHPYDYWRRLEMPAFAVLSIPDLTVLNTVARVC